MIHEEEGRQTLGRVCGKIRREGRILQASKAADEHVCRGAMKSTVVLSVAAVSGHTGFLAYLGQSKTGFQECQI